MVRNALIPLVLFLAGSIAAQELPAGRINDARHGIFDHDLLGPEFHRGRREALRGLMPAGSVAILAANPVRNRSNDVNYEYHQDPDLYYLTGLREPHALLFLWKDSALVDGRWTRELLVVQERDPAREIWDGYRLGAEGGAEVLGIAQVITGKAFLNASVDLGRSGPVFQRRILENLANDPHDPADLHDLLARVDVLTARTKAGEPEDLRDWLAGLREVKQPEEIELLRQAITITCEAQRTLMRCLMADMTEYQTEAIIEYVFKVRGAEYAGFPSIQGGGPHSCVLHYVTNRRTLAHGDLLVSDVGAEYRGYTADVTRTLPVNGRFTPEQRTIYDLVLRAQEAGIEAVGPGAPFFAGHLAATAIIAKGLVELGIIDEESQVRRYFMHGTSHYLGLDVHDPGSYGPLRPNTVITVEPGIYIPQGSPCDPKWWDIGVRIEDDILITATGRENLSACVPRKAEEVEALMALPPELPQPPR